MKLINYKTYNIDGTYVCKHKLNFVICKHCDNTYCYCYRPIPNKFHKFHNSTKTNTLVAQKINPEPHNCLLKITYY